ncbi:MAG: type I-F CRISPR-associated protein Csy1, partial [Legionella sp.]
IMHDGNTLIHHIEINSELAKSLLTIKSESYENLRKGFLAMAATDNVAMTTSTKIKQVYFPVDHNSYHLLSVLSNSGLIYELRKRIDDLRFSEQPKAARDLKRHNQISDHGFSELYNITTIGYGGTKPQNISVLNNKNGGKARLLLSIPPHMQQREVHFPKKNFFHSSIRFYDIAEPLQKLDMMFKTGLETDLPRRHLEKSRDNRIEEILDIIIERVNAVRAVGEEQYHSATSTLPLIQQIWLLKEYRQLRLEQEEWLDSLCDEITLWILAAYRKIIKKALILGPAEHAYINAVLTTHREALR